MPRLFFFAIVLRPPTSTLFPYTTLFRSIVFLDEPTSGLDPISAGDFDELIRTLQQTLGLTVFMVTHEDRKSTRLNSSHVEISYAVFCLKKKNRFRITPLNFS